MFDMGICKLYMDPTTGVHMRCREDRKPVGTPRYASHNAQLGIGILFRCRSDVVVLNLLAELSRRDDTESLGMVLLYLLHPRLPWQSICARDIPAKLRRIGEMKRGKPLEDLLSRSPAFLTSFFKHCRSLSFEERPDYAYLRGLMREEMRTQGWEYDWKYDWLYPGERGTLVPEEYRLDLSLVEPVRQQLMDF